MAKFTVTARILPDGGTLQKDESEIRRHGQIGGGI